MCSRRLAAFEPFSYAASPALINRVIRFAKLIFFLNITSSQVIDYSALKPVRKAEFQGSFIKGLCVSRDWLLVTHSNNSLCVYRLPELQYQDQVNFSFEIMFPHADQAGLVYIPAWEQSWISILTVSDTGSVTVNRNLTLGNLQGGIDSVATGPQLGELCVLLHNPPRVIILNVADDRVTYNLSLPVGTESVLSVAVLDTGQILVIVYVDDVMALALYSSYDRSPVLLNNTSPLGAVTGMINHANHFLLTLPNYCLILVVDAEGKLTSTVDALNGKGGVWLDMVFDVAIWDNCVWVLSFYRSLVLLCPV